MITKKTETAFSVRKAQSMLTALKEHTTAALLTTTYWKWGRISILVFILTSSYAPRKSTFFTDRLTNLLQKSAKLIAPPITATLSAKLLRKG